MKHTLLAASIVVFTGACGGSDEPTHQGTINPTGARTSVASVHDVFAALDSGSGESAADAVMALTAAGQIVVAPGQARGPELPARAYLPARWPKPIIASFTGSATCDASGCTFDNFGDDSEYGSYRIDGSIRRTGDVLAFDLTYDIITDGLEFHWELDGNVRANATLIDGDMHSHGEALIESEGERYDIGWDFDLAYDDIILDASGCPVGGSLSATVAYAVAGAGSYRAAGSVSFGPACGQYGAN